MITTIRSAPTDARSWALRRIAMFHQAVDHSCSETRPYLPAGASQLLRKLSSRLKDRTLVWSDDLAEQMRPVFNRQHLHLARLGHLDSYDRFRDIESLLFLSENRFPPLFARCESQPDLKEAIGIADGLIEAINTGDLNTIRNTLRAAVLESSEVHGVSTQDLLEQELSKFKAVAGITPVDAPLQIYPSYCYTRRRVRLLNLHQSGHAIRLGGRAMSLVYGKILGQWYVVGID